MPEYVVRHGSVRFYNDETGPSGRRYQLGEIVELDEKEAKKLLDLGALSPREEVEDPEALDPAEPTGTQRVPLEKPKASASREDWVQYANEEYNLGLAADTSRAEAIRKVEEAERKVGQ